MVATQTRISAVLRKAYEDLTNLMDLSGPDKVSYSVYAERRAGIERLVRNMTRDFDLATKAGIRENASDVRDIYAGLNERYNGFAGQKIDYRNAFNTVPTEAVNNVLNRIWGDGQVFSDRIWRLNQISSNGINEIISSGISRGQSAVNMAKDLRQYLIEPEITDSTSWTTGVKKSVTGNGTINYNALRLARTEINNSYREALVIANEKNPIMLGMRWNLSANHPRPDVCDMWAKLDAYGLGPGVYPADKMPIDHPGGRCFFTEVLRAASQWSQPKPEPGMVRLTDAQLAAPLGSDVTPGYRNAMIKAFKSNVSLINRMRKAA